MTRPGDARTRTRLVWTMVAVNALASTAYIAVASVAPLTAERMTGSAALAGLPGTALTVGTAAGAIALGSLGARRGRRPSFTLGLALAAIGAALVVVASLAGAVLAVVGALLVLGFGRSATQLARYAAGDLRGEDRRGRAISLVVWASTVGAVVGPQLLAPAGRGAVAAGLPEDLGPIAVAVALFVVATVVVAAALRPDPLSLARREPTEPSTLGGAGVAPLLRRPTVRLSMVVLATSQLVMVLVMTMTPLHVRGAGEDLAAVGIVMSAHTLGMFAFAPVTGWLVDSLGARRVMGAGGAVLAGSCALAATAGGSDQLLLVGSLLGLGYGWNLAFVAASAHLQHGLVATDRARVQGVADAATWLAGGLGAAVSGVVVAAGSYTVLAVLGAALAVVVPAALATIPSAVTEAGRPPS